MHIFYSNVNSHFHYGYFIYAATILSRRNSTFYSNYRPHISALVSDIASDVTPPTPSSHSNTVSGDTSTSSSTSKNDETKSLSELFPSARHKSWYDGHSWASGLFPQANGKGQESSSEAINAYYATYLWHHFDGNTKAQNFARLLLATEIRSAKTYWHTGPSSKIYPPQFSENYMVGNLGGLDATSTTWFGDKIIYVHLINVMPVTSITQELFQREYVQKQLEFLEPYIHTVEESWKGYVLALQGIVDAEAAWKDALDVASYKLDTAISKSQLLYWIATRPDFASNWNVTATTGGTSDKKQCSSNPRCSGAGLTGQCCPTTDGTMLGCCD